MRKFLRHLLVSLILFLFPVIAFGQGVPIKSGSSSTLANVDANNNLQVNMPTTASQAGYVRTLAGTSARGPDVRGTGVQRFLTATDRLLFFDPVESTTINGNLWGGSTATETVAVTVANGIRLNNGSSTTTGQAARIVSNATFPYMTEAPLVLRWNFKTNVAGQANQQVEMGLMNAAITTTPTDGVYFRYSTAGTFLAVATFASVDTTSASLSVPTINVWHSGMIVRRSRDTEFFIDDTLVATITAATADPAVTSLQHLPITFRTWNNGTPSTAPVLDISQTVVYGELQSSDDYATQLAQFGRKAVNSPVTAYGQTAVFANSTNPTDVTPVNTTSAGAGQTSLGGLIDFVPTLTAETDVILWDYTVPTSFQLWVYGVTCDFINVGATGVGTAIQMGLFLGTNSSATSLATTDTAGPPWTAWGPRRVALGNVAFAATAAVGATPTYPTSPMNYRFQPPLVIEAGRHFHIGWHPHSTQTAAASQVIRTACYVDSVFH